MLLPKKSVLCVCAWIIVCVTWSGIALADVSEQAEPQPYQTMDSLFVLYQPYLASISAYKPMYFLVGAHPENSRFQFSFKYRFLNSDETVVSRHPWLNGLHFAYTQSSFWDLNSPSAPFRDTSYKPELFFLSSNFYHGSSQIERFFIQAGVEHESNGRDGFESRSTNYIYCQPIFIFLDTALGTGIQIAPKFFVYVGNDNKNNPDLDKYRGYFDLMIKMGQKSSLVCESHFRSAHRGSSIQVDLSYPLNRHLHSPISVYLHAQYVNVLAEKLIDYKKRTEAFRLGFSVVR